MTLFFINECKKVLSPNYTHSIKPADIQLSCHDHSELAKAQSKRQHTRQPAADTSPSSGPST